MLPPTQLKLINVLQSDFAKINVETRILLSHIDILNQPTRPGKWTIAQIIEHLNTYNKYYLPEIENAFAIHNPIKPADDLPFKPGFIGSYLTKMMRPNDSGRVGNKMKAFKKHVPAPDLNARQVLQEFIEGQSRFSNIIERSLMYDLNNVRIGMSISRLIRLRLGDLLNVLVVHQQRHFIQVNETLQLLGIHHQLQDS
jgi:hypothetical protein